jgi:hypothetical protein
MDFAREKRSGNLDLFSERKKRPIYHKKSMIDNYRKNPNEWNNTYHKE